MDREPIRGLVLHRGLAVARWRRVMKKGAITVEVRPYESLKRSALDALERAVNDLGRFERLSATVELLPELM
jgi:hypothetical protein